ncbi:MAG: glycosyl hydrolase family 28-related protein [Chthoniobacterales bacterium]
MIKSTFLAMPITRAALLMATAFSWFALTASAEIVPANRMTDWTAGVVVGVPGGIPSRTKIYKNVVADLGADNTGAADVSALVNAAIASCPADQVIYFPVGKYKIGASIGIPLKQRYTIKGAGVGKTIFKPAPGFGSQIFSAGPSDWPAPPTAANPARAITAGAVKDSNRVTIANTEGLSVGTLIQIRAGTNPTYVHNLLGISGDMGWMFRITSLTSDTVTFTPPLPLDIGEMSPQVVAYNAYGANGTISGVGYEDFSYDGTGGNASDVFGLSQAWGCWIKNVEASGFPHRCLGWGRVMQNEVRHCYFHGGANGSGGEGGDLIGLCSWNLIEDNIIYNGGAIVLTDAYNGTGGNVIGYNYLYAHNTPDPTLAASDIDMNHGSGNSFNLLEGNVIGSVSGNDGYYGSTSHCTIFRNWITATHPVATNGLRCIVLKHYAVYFNVVGNVLGTPAFPQTNNGIGVDNPGQARGGYYDAPEVNSYDNGASTGVQVIFELGFPQIGNTSFNGQLAATTPPDYSSEPTNPQGPPGKLDLNVKATLLRHGNYDFFHRDVVWDPSIEDRTIPKSLYLLGKPSWWPPNLDWPLIGPDKSLDGATNPAKMRYEAMGANQPSAPSGLHVAQ